MSKARSKLEKCDEICKYNSGGVCCFGLRDVTCYLDEGSKALAEEYLRLKLNEVRK